MSDSETRLLSDSTTVLTWIKSDATKYKPFVKNKIIEIQDTLPVNKWSYIPSKQNKAADAISKGCNKSQLQMIIDGPEILRIPEKQWPDMPINCYSKEKYELKRNEITVAMIEVKPPIINIRRFSSWSKLLRLL